MNIKTLAQFGISVATLLLGMSAYGATATDTFQVTATIPAACVITANDLAFGTYNPTTTSTQNSTVDVTCTNTTPWAISLSTGGSGSYSPRQMTGGVSADTLNYNLYTDATFTTIWGDGTGGTTTVTGTGTGAAQSNTVYGQLPSGQYKTPDSYTDTITATVTY
ncbi:MAG: spore coat protein U domain-containing protein [Gammaproteobacteria bacterium]|nr:spore coat protein U domain-containing protein [Gammaproteobacteria bacterium]